MTDGVRNALIASGLAIGGTAVFFVGGLVLRGGAPDCPPVEVTFTATGWPDAGAVYVQGYVQGRDCSADDGGGILLPTLPGGVTAMDVRQVDAGLGTSTDVTFGPFMCACSAGVNCLRDGVPAHQTVTLQPGAWAGADCVPKPCVEVEGISSWPDACPQ